jgi:hypothetical protein
VAETLRHPLFWLVLLPTALAWSYWAYAYARNWVRRGMAPSLFIAAAAMGWVVDVFREAGLLPRTSLVNAGVEVASLLVGVLGAVVLWQTERRTAPRRGPFS